LELSWEEKHENSSADKLDHLIGQKATEKRGKGWALTSFMREALGSTKKEFKNSI
jgi:hypothetical protein